MWDMIKGGPPVETYLAFSEHAGGCERCGPLRKEVVRHTHRPKDEIRRLFARACREGEALLWAWDTAVQDRVQEPSTAYLPRQLGIWTEWQGRKERVEALMDVPQDDLQLIAAVEDVRAREGEIESIVRGYRRRHLAIVPAEVPQERRCRVCGGKVKSPDHDLCWKCWKAGK